MKKRCIFPVVFFLLFILSLPAPAVAKNYCSDPEARQHWRDLSARYPRDDLVQTLHALWLGLCIKVKAGEMDEKQAVDLFEKARVAAVSVRKEQVRQDRKKAKAGI